MNKLQQDVKSNLPFSLSLIHSLIYSLVMFMHLCDVFINHSVLFFMSQKKRKELQGKVKLSRHSDLQVVEWGS